VSEYNEKWRYVTLCWKIWSWQVAGNDVTGWTQSVFTKLFYYFHDKKYCAAWQLQQYI